MNSPLLDAYRRLFEHYGPQRWWPAETPWEVMVGAVLTQNTSWKNVERAIANLRREQLLDLAALAEIGIDELAELIRPAGYYRLKARRLSNLVRFVRERHGGSLETMFARDLPELRAQLLSINGIGPETADAILLYAGARPVFVIDAYATRVLARHGWCQPDADYHRLQEQFHSSLPEDASLYNEYHALLVQVGKDYCRRQQPLCEGCPLADMLPPGGPIASWDE